MNYSCSTS